MRYLPRLVDIAAPLGWRVIQPILRSSYTGWGLGSLDEDVADIDSLLENSVAERGITSAVLLGHSTGCQDVVKFLADGAKRTMVKGAILQAPVSDRQALALTNTGNKAAFEADLSKYETMAKTMIAQGKGDEIMPRAACLLVGPPHAITAYRFNSLTGRMTDDDMFSSDLTDGELSRKFYHVGVPTLVAMSLDDEYVPKTVDMSALAERMNGLGDGGADPAHREGRPRSDHTRRSKHFPDGRKDVLDGPAPRDRAVTARFFLLPA